MNIATQQLIKQMAADIEALKARVASLIDEPNSLVNRVARLEVESIGTESRKVLSLKRG